MLERKALVRVREGLHARPAAEFVRLACGFAADLEIVRGDKTANAKSAVKLMLLGVKEHDEIILRAKGADAFEALQALSNFVATRGELGQPQSDRLAEPAVAGAPASDSSLRPADRPLRGAPASEGAAFGPAFAFFREVLVPPFGAMEPRDAEKELLRLRAAVRSLASDLSAQKQSATPGSDDAAIIEALAEIARDDALLGRIEALIREGADAASAALQAGAELGDEFARLDDVYLRGRSEDVRAVARRIALVTLGKADVSLSEAPAGSVILAEELSALDLAGGLLEKIAGIVCAKGAPTSHVAIVARAHGIPAVLGLDVDIARLRKAKTAALDGLTGEVSLDPDEATLAAFQARIEGDTRERVALRAYVGVEPRTRAGKLIEIAANLGSLKEIDAARAVGAMGVGLFRTELMFMERKRPPTEDEQVEVYAKTRRSVRARFGHHSHA